MPEGRFLVYLCSVLLAVTGLLIATGSSTSARDVKLPGRLVDKVQTYRTYADQFDTIFLGDSRTYCAMHPHRLNELLDIQSINLATWAHWLPTQFAQIKDLIDWIPKGATVIWSVGYQNFHVCEKCETKAYPIGKKNAQLYADFGLPKFLYEDNVKTLEPITSLTGNLVRKESYTSSLFEIYSRILQWLQKPLQGDKSNPKSRERYALSKELVNELRAQPYVLRATIIEYEGRPTSIEVLFNHGGYERIETDPEFFRQKQNEQVQANIRDVPPVRAK